MITQHKKEREKELTNLIIFRQKSKIKKKFFLVKNYYLEHVVNIFFAVFIVRDLCEVLASTLHVFPIFSLIFELKFKFEVASEV